MPPVMPAAAPHIQSSHGLESTAAAKAASVRARAARTSCAMTTMAIALARRDARPPRKSAAP